MTWGLLPTGFNRPRLADLIPEYQAAFRAVFGADIVVDGDSLYGQLIGILAEREAELWELVEAVYHSAYPDTAEGVSLALSGTLTGHTPFKATYSTVTVTCGTNGTSPVTLPAGRQVRVPSTLATFETTAEVTIPAGGTVDVACRAIETGPIEAPAGTLTEIVTPVAGWDTVTNAADAVVGRYAETDAEFRLRRARELVIARGGTIGAMETRIRNEVAGVTYCAVSENRSSLTVNGLKPHSVHVTVIGGADQAVADKIWETKPAGADTNGSESATVYDSYGKPHVLYWDRVTPVRIYLVVAVDGVVAVRRQVDDQVRDILAAFDDRLDHGQDLLNWQLVASLTAVPGILTVEILQGTAPGPTLSDNIAIAGNEKASIAAADITVNS